MNIEKLKAGRTVFKKDGTVTAANASSLNDGAAAIVLVSAQKCQKLGLTPIAKLRGWGEAAQVRISRSIFNCSQCFNNVLGSSKIYYVSVTGYS